MRAFWGVILALAIGGGVAAAGFALANRSNAGRAPASGSGGVSVADYRSEVNDICRRTKEDMEQIAQPSTVAGVGDYFAELVQTGEADQDQILEFPVPPALAADASKMKAFIRRDKRILAGFVGRARRVRSVKDAKRLVVSFAKTNARISPPEDALALRMGLTACAS